MDKENSSNLIDSIRAVLKNELTWAVFIAGFIISCYNLVIIPILNIQTQLTSIQTSLAEIKATNQSYESRITNNSNDLIRLKEILKIN